MTQPDETHTVLYKVIADFAEHAKAQAEIRAEEKKTADQIERDNKRVKVSDTEVGQNRERLARIQKGLTQDQIRGIRQLDAEVRGQRVELGRYDQALARVAAAQRLATASSDAVFASISRQTGAFLEARRAAEEHARALRLAQAAANELLGQPAATAALPGRGPVQATASASSSSGGGGGFSIAQLAAIAALMGSRGRGQTQLQPQTVTVTSPTRVVITAPPAGATATPTSGPTPILSTAPGTTRQALPPVGQGTIQPSRIFGRPPSDIDDLERRIKERAEGLLEKLGITEQDLNRLLKIRLVNAVSALEQGSSPGAAARMMATGSQRGDLASQIAALIRKEGQQAGPPRGPAGPQIPTATRPPSTPPTPTTRPTPTPDPGVEIARQAEERQRKFEEDERRGLAMRALQEEATRQQAERLAERRRRAAAGLPPEGAISLPRVRPSEGGAADDDVEAEEEVDAAQRRRIETLRQQAAALRVAREESERQANSTDAARESDERFRKSLDDSSDSQLRFAQTVRRSERDLTMLAGRLRSIRSESEGEDLLRNLTREQRKRVGELADIASLDPARRGLVERALGDVVSDVPLVPKPPGGKERQVLETVAEIRKADSPAQVFAMLNGLTNDQLKQVAEKLGTSTTGARLKRELEAKIVKGRFPELGHPALSQRKTPRKATPPPTTAESDLEDYAPGGGPARLAKARAAQAEREAAETAAADARFERAVKAEAQRRQRIRRELSESEPDEPLAPLSQGHTPSHLEQVMRVPRDISDKVADLRRDQARAHKDDIDALRFASDETKRAHRVLEAFVPLLEKKNTALRAQKAAHDQDRVAMDKAAKGTEKYSGFLAELSSDLQAFQDRVSNRQRFDLIDAEAAKRSVEARDADTAAMARSTAETTKAESAVGRLLQAFRDKNRALEQQAESHDHDAEAVRESTGATQHLDSSVNRFTTTLQNTRGAFNAHNSELKKGSYEASEAYSIYQRLRAEVANQSSELKKYQAALANSTTTTRSFGSAGRAASQSARAVGQAAQAATPQVGGLTSAVQRLRGANRRGGGDDFVGRLLIMLANWGDRVGTFLGRAVTHIVSFRAAVYTLIAALGPVVAVLGALGAAAIGAGNTLVSLAGAALALPAIFGAAAIGIGTLATALGPIAAAFKAYKAQQDAVTQGSRAAGDAQRDAADRVRNAERAYVSAARALANAQYDEKRAQQDLNDARRDALRDLQDLRRELERSTLNEQSAILSLKEAQDAYLRTLADPNATLLDRQRALLRIYEAEQDLKDVRLDNQRLIEDAADAERRGVDGSRQVVDARRRAYEATVAVAEAALRLEDATEDLADAQREGAVGGSAAAKAADALADALEKLGPNTRTVVLALFGMAEAWKQIQRNVSERIFGPIVPQLDNLKSLLPIVEKFLYGAADAIGVTTAKGIEMVSSGPWKRDFGVLAESNAKIMTSLGDAGLYVADGLRHVVVAAAPFSEWVAQAISDTGKGFRDWAEGARESGAVADFLDTTKDRLSQVWVIIKNLTAGFWSLFTASEEFTSWLLDRIESVTLRFRDWAKAQEATTSPFKQWLEDVKPLLSDVWHLIESLGGAFGRMASDTKNMDEARRILQILSDRILPKISEIFTHLSETGVISTLADAVATFLDGLNTFIEKGGATPIQTFAKTLSLIAGYWKEIAENPVTFTLLSGFLTVVGALVAVSAVGKLTGLFLLARTVARIVRNFGLLRSLRPGAVLDDITRSRGGLGGLRDALSERGSTPRNPLYVWVVNDGPDGNRRPGPGGATGGGGGGTVVAGGGGGASAGRGGRLGRVLRGAGRLALPASLLALLLPGLLGGDEEEGGGGLGGFGAVGLGLLGLDLLGNVPFGGGGGGGAAGAGRGIGGILGRLGRVTLPATAVAASAANIFSAGRDLITDPSTRADPTRFGTLVSPIQRTVQPAAQFIGRNLIAPLLPDSHPLSDPAKWTDEIMTPTFENFKKIFEGVSDWLGQKVGEPARWIQENLVEPVTDWLGGVWDWVSDHADDPQEWIEENITRPLLDWLAPFSDIILGTADAVHASWNAFVENWQKLFSLVGGWISDSWSVANEWVHEWLTVPTRNAVRGLGRWVARAWSAANRWAHDWLTVPTRNAVRGVGRWIGRAWSAANAWVHEWLTVPTRNAIRGVGRWIGRAWSAANRWAHDHLTVPVQTFFRSIGDFFRNLPRAIERWAESLPGIGPFIRERREQRESSSITFIPGHQTGGLIRGASSGVDATPILATVGEFMVRKRVVDKPGMRQLLTALNEEQLDPTALYAALDIATRQGGFPYQIPAQVIGAAPTTITSNRTGLSMGDVIINNPRQERSSQSIRRTLQTLAFMSER